MGIFFFFFFLDFLLVLIVVFHFFCCCELLIKAWFDRHGTGYFSFFTLCNRTVFLSIIPVLSGLAALQTPKRKKR